MADVKITGAGGLTEIGAALVDGDYLVVVDVSDTAQSADGSTRKLLTSRVTTKVVADIDAGGTALTIYGGTTSLGSVAAGGLVNNNFVMADAAVSLVDSAKTVPAGAVVGTTDTQTLTNKSATDVKITNTVNAQTGTTYTLVLADLSKVVTMDNASSQVLTIPTNASVAFPVGGQITVSQLGAGVTTVDGTTGVTVNGVSGGGAAISARYSGVVLTKLATDTWLMQGNHGAVA